MSDYERIVSVDPGVTTGLVCVDLPGNWRGHSDLYSLLASLRSGPASKSLEIRGDESAQIDEFMRHIMPSHASKGVGRIASIVVIESFSLRERTKNPNLLAPVRIGAKLDDRLYVARWPGKLVWQSPSDAKSIVTDERLKNWGLYESGSDHIRDAWRHLVKCLRDNS